MRMPRCVGPIPRLLCVVLALFLLATPAPAAQAIQQVSIKLNHSLDANQRVLDFRLSPDGSRILYRVGRTLPPAQDNPPPPPADLFSVATAGGAAVQLNPPAAHETESVESYQFGPDGDEVIYLRTTFDPVLGNVFELFRAAVDGSMAGISVSGPIPVGARALRDFDFSIEQATLQLPFEDGSVRAINYRVHHRTVPERLTSIADGTSNTFFFGEQVNNLLQTPIGGGPRQLNPALANGGVVYGFQTTPDGTRVIYQADQNLDGTIELFSVPSDGSDAGFRISGPMVAGGDVVEFKVNASSSRAIYRADQNTNGVVELYSARTNGGIVTKLNAPLAGGGNVTRFELSPDGSLVVYLADQLADQKFDLFAVATVGSAVTRLSGGVEGDSVRGFMLSPDGGSLFFVDRSQRGGALTLFRRPLALGATPLEPLPGPPVAALADPDLKVSADGSRLVYLADDGGDGVYELASIDLTGTLTPTHPLNAPLVAGGNIRGFVVSPDGQRVVYAADQNTPGVVELFSVPAGGGPVEPVSGPLVEGGTVSADPLDLQMSPDGRSVYYLADQENDDVTELYAAFAAPVVAFTQPLYVVVEDGSSTPQLTVKRTGNLTAPSSVRVQLTGEPDGGTARGGASLSMPGVDFVDNARDVLFASGEMTRTFSVALQDDGVPEAAEDFSMLLFEPEQAVIEGQDEAQVIILDSPDAPLLADATFSLPENSAAGTQLRPQRSTTVAAESAAGAAITHTLLTGNTGDAFRVDAAGSLVVNNSAALDYETTPAFDLVVEARADNGSSDIATWSVTLENVNEPPSFAAQTRSIAENSPNGRSVGSRLAASDPEGDPLTFSMPSGVFRISADGQLLVADGSKLDFETQMRHDVAVTVTDDRDLSAIASIRIDVVDVAEGDPLGPAIFALTPSSAVAGGSGFKLTVRGKNLSSKMVVRWNGSERRTVFTKDGLSAAISAQDIGEIATVKITVFDSASGKSSPAESFAVTRGPVGLAALTGEPGDSTGSVVGRTTVFNLEWTHTSEAWRAMDEMDLRLVDGEQIPLWVRYQETRDESGADISTLTLLNADGTPAGRGRFGSDTVLENATVRLDLAGAQFLPSSENPSYIRVRLPVVFKQTAAQDEPYRIEMYGVDDLGGEQGPNLMGDWTVSMPVLYLPAVQGG